MDKITVSAEGLHSAFGALTDFRDRAQQTMLHYTKLISDQKDNLDEEFRAEVLQYVQQLKGYCEQVDLCVTENQRAILDRRKHLSEYAGTTYTRRPMD